MTYGLKTTVLLPVLSSGAQLFILGHREKGALETEKKNTNEDSSMSRGEGVGGRKGCNFKASF